MKRTISIALLCIMPLSASYAGNDTKKYVAESKAVIKDFSRQLKGELGKSMKAGGPVATIDICNKTAPSIAKALSEKYNMKVARTSLKTRNSTNAPDMWEEVVLKKFEKRRAAGESPKDMAYFEIVEKNGQKNFRFMKAIGMPPLTKMPCLKCHGENLNSKITAKLDKLYPDDKARGYKPGQIRGAFTITKPLM